MLGHAWEDVVASPKRLRLEEVDTRRLRKAVHVTASYGSVKRVLDTAVVLLAAPAVFLVIAVAALLVLVMMGRPVFFIQGRVGLHGRAFQMLKLRTMRPSVSAGVATALNDARITPLGRFLRRSHIDELPQLWSVLTGDMALIGPRPEQPELVAQYRQLIPHYDLRHSVRPGLSGWSQVSFGYAATVEETRRKLEYDLFYIQHFGPRIDLEVLALTVIRYANPHYVR
jgi:lipopolysaccharide/colanic/teichoic acid biosynthesis glycosyltransferase